MGSVALETDVQQSALDCRNPESSQEEQRTQPFIDEFEALYVAHRSRVWALCLRMTGNPDLAEDLTQETFVRLFQKLDTFRGESPFSTWLRRIAINVVLLRFQKASWRRETSMEELTRPDPVTACPYKIEFGRVDSRLLGTIDRISLQRAIGQLSPGFRTVLVLHDIEGYEHVEISKLLGCSIGTSKSQLHKARLKMRELLLQKVVAQTARYGQGAAKVSRASRTRRHAVMQFSHRVHHRNRASASAVA